MSDTLRARVTEYMYGHGDADRAIEAAEAEVARRDEQHAKERAEWEKEKQANVQYRSLLLTQLRGFEAELGKAESEKQAAVESILERADIELAKAVEKERRLAEAEKQAAVAAALAAEKERMLPLLKGLGYVNADGFFVEVKPERVYPPAKVTLLPAGLYWWKEKKLLASRGWNSPAWFEDGDTGEFAPNPDWEYIKAEPPPNPYAAKAKDAEPTIGQKVVERLAKFTEDLEAGDISAYKQTTVTQAAEPVKSPARKPTLAEWCERNSIKDGTKVVGGWAWWSFGNLNHGRDLPMFLMLLRVVVSLTCKPLVGIPSNIRVLPKPSKPCVKHW